MSYNLTLSCGCAIYVSCHPVTNVAHTRVIERRGARCRHRRHAVGERVWLWEMLPEPGTGSPAREEPASGERTPESPQPAGSRR